MKANLRMPLAAGHRVPNVGGIGLSDSFFAASAIGGKTLEPGRVDNEGVATKIVITSGAPTVASTIGVISNSSSPPPSQRRPMRGKVEEFNARTGMAKIRGEDDTTYRFFPAGVGEGKEIETRQNDQFIDHDGIATDIQLVCNRFMRVLFGA